MHGDFFLAQRWTGAGGEFDVLGEPVFERVAAERLSGLCSEQRIRRISGALGKPNAQDGDHAGGERRDPQLTTLPRATDVCAGEEMDMKRTEE